MTVAQLMLVLLENLPAIIKMLSAMAANADKAAVNEKVKNDLKIIEEAFRTRDSAALERLFSNR